jgi:hypothetical protein
MLNFVSRLKVLHFWLDSCIANKGEKFELEMACWMHLEGFQVVLSHFLGSGVHRSDRSRSPVWPVRVLVLFTCCTPVWPVVLTGLTGQGWVVATALFQVVFLHAFVQGELHLFRGSLHVRRGALYGFSSFGLVVCAFCLSFVCLGCVELLLLPKGSETCLRQVILFFAFVWLSIACWSFFLFVSFLFLFSLVTLCGCCQCTHQGGDWGPCVVWGPVDSRFLVWW